VVARARAIESAAGELAGEVGRLRDLRGPLGAIRTATRETDEVVAAFRDQHPFEGDAPGAGA
jgi:hypothetical protein